MPRLLTNKEFSRMSDEYDKVKYKCECGHRVVIPTWMNKKLCDWCNKYVFKNKKDEFKYRIDEQLRRKNERELERYKKL